SLARWEQHTGSGRGIGWRLSSTVLLSCWSDGLPDRVSASGFGLVRAKPGGQRTLTQLVIRVPCCLMDARGMRALVVVLMLAGCSPSISNELIEHNSGATPRPSPATEVRLPPPEAYI